MTPEEEREVARFIATVFKREQRRTYEPGKTPKAVHHKTHAVLSAEFVVPEILPPRFRWGIFAHPQRIPCRLRFSSSSSAMSSDLKPSITGLAIQLQDEAGQPLGLGFTLQTMKTFPLGTPAVAYDLFYWISFTPFFSLNIVLVCLVFLLKGNIHSLWALKNAYKTKSSLNFETFYSCTPWALGPHEVVKYRVRPMKHRPPMEGFLYDDDFLTHELDAFYAKEGFKFEFAVQLQESANNMPIEDASVLWEEHKDRGGCCFFPVAHLYIPPQVVEDAPKMEWGELAQFDVDDCKFPDHAPLGGLNRIRRWIYEDMHEFHRASLLK